MEISTIKNPYTGDTLDEIELVEEKDFLEITENSKKAWEKFRGEPLYLREEILTNLSNILIKKSEDFAELIMLESGKPISLARTEVKRAIITLKEGAKGVYELKGEEFSLEQTPFSKGINGYTKYVPRGPLFAIHPYNFPLNLMIHKIAPAIASGNSVIVKPPTQTPLTPLLFKSVVDSLDIPKNLIQITPISNKIAENFLNHDNISQISFTGSEDIGWHIRKIASDKPVFLELGGVATMIVDESADLEKAAKRGASSAFSFGGQVCISLQKILVHKSISTIFEKLFIKYSKEIVSGNPSDELVLNGPLINDIAVKKFYKFYNNSVENGATTLLKPQQKGNIITPTIVKSDNYNLLIHNEEAFSPIVVISEFENFEKAIKIANSTKYGLQASIFSEFLPNIQRGIKDLEFGTVLINETPSFRNDRQPYGGVKRSGLGREGVFYAMKDFSELKTIIFSSNF